MHMFEPMQEERINAWLQVDNQHFNNIATILRPFLDYLFWGHPIYKAEKNRSDWGKYTGRTLFCHLWTELNLNLNLCAYHRGGWPNDKRKHS